MARNIDEAKERQAKYCNKGRKEILFNVGDKFMTKVHVLSDAS